MNKMRIAMSGLFAAVVFAVELHGEAADWLQDLHRACSYIPFGCLCEPDDGEYIPPTPDDVIAKYGMTTNAILDGLKTLVLRYGVAETNEYKIAVRDNAVSYIGRYGTTNDLEFLAPILNDPEDYTQQIALGASMTLLSRTDQLIPFMFGVATNRTTFSKGLRTWAECRLTDMCRTKSSHYIDDPALHAKIAAYFIERAKDEVESSLDVDSDACRLNPWYRHSQLRRGNLARARSREENLTETAAAAYDARQSDAAAEGDLSI